MIFMKNDKILIVEDDVTITNLIQTTLSLHDYAYYHAANGQDAIQICANKKPDIVLLDLGLPDIDGIQVIQSIRTWSTLPIIVISARDEIDDKIKALDAGADDYLTKPFSVEELLARIRATFRRLQAPSSSEQDSIFQNGLLKIDYSSNIVSVDDSVIHLTQIEYRLLCLLAQNIGKVLTHTYIIDHIWGNEIESDIISLRVYMTSLRKKIRSSNNKNECIQTHIGIGYQMIRL